MTTGRPDQRTTTSPGSQELPQRTPARAPVLRVLPGTPAAAGTARRLTQEVLGDGHPATETAMLLVSELVTNSITHSRSRLPGGTVTVALCAGPAGVFIQVRDDGGSAAPRLPHANGACHDGVNPDSTRPDCTHRDAADHGYGLVLVAALADTWGTIATAEGRVTWCRVSGDTCATGEAAR